VANQAYYNLSGKMHCRIPAMNKLFEQVHGGLWAKRRRKRNEAARTFAVARMRYIAQAGEFTRSARLSTLIRRSSGT